MSTLTAVLQDAVQKRLRQSESAAPAVMVSDQAVQRRTVSLTPASQIQPRPVRWLWALRLALGTLALLGGREGIGKSLVAYTLIGMLTRGRLPGIHFGKPKPVIVAATEDDWGYTIVPRLMAVEADLDLVFRVDVTTAEGGDGALSLPRDLVALEELIASRDVALLLLDPLLSRLDSNLDTHKDAEVRLALEPLVSLASRTGCCALGLIHVNKSSSGDVLTTLMASRAFAAVARAVLFVMIDPDNEQTRLLGQAKNNLGRTDLPTLTFQVEEVKAADSPEGPVMTGKLVWLGETDRSIGDAMAVANEMGHTTDKTAVAEAMEWLTDYLAGGPKDFAVLKADGFKAGHSKDTLRRAKQRVGAISKTQGFPRKAFWSLPPVSASVGASRGETATTTFTASTESTDAPVSAVSAVSAPLQAFALTDAPTGEEGSDADGVF